MTSDPKEALERLKSFASCAHVDTDAGRAAQTCVVSIADLRTLIAKQEGLEREVERQKHENNRLHEVIAGIISTDAGNRAALEAATARLSALQEACKAAREQFRFYVDQHLAKSPPDYAKAETNRDFVRMLDVARALLPTVPVEGS